MKPKLLQKLQELVAYLYSARDLETLAKYIRGTCREVFQVQHVAVFYMSEDWDELYGVRPGDDEPIHFPKGEGLAGMVAEEQECLLIEGTAGNPVFNDAIDGVRDYKPENILSAPVITAKGDLVGVIQLIDKTSGRFRTDDEDLLMQFGRQTGEAVVACRQNEESETFLRTILESIAGGVDAKYAHTVGHTARVRDLALGLARARELPESLCRNIEYGALLHNLGRLAYNTDISGLAPEEEAGQNLLFSEAIIKGITFPTGMNEVAAIAVHCNEYADGSGKPEGLTLNQIPVGARILAVCDAYDTLFFQGNEEVEKYSDEQVLGYLKKQAGKRFDPELVDVFINEKIYEKEKRRHQRIEYTGKVDVTLLNSDGTDGMTFKTRILDLSSGGVLFLAEEKMELNVMLKLRIHLVTGLMRSIVRTARVMDNTEGEGYKIGAYFIWSSSR